MKKTYKVGEYVVGGIVSIEFKENEFDIKFKDWDTKQVILEGKFKDKFDAEMFIFDNGTSYYADKIINFK